MADLTDKAQEQEARNRDAAIRAALKPPAGTGSGPFWQDGKPLCRDCGEVIPLARLRAMPSTGLCVSCATLAQR